MGRDMIAEMLGLLLTVAATAATAQQKPTGTVSVTDSGLKTSPATYECTSGHPVKRQTVTLDSTNCTQHFRAKTEELLRRFQRMFSPAPANK